MASVRFYNDHINEKCNDEILLVDGQVFDRYSSPLRGPEGQHHGRVWFFHDISETRSRTFKTNGLEDKARAFGAKVAGKQISMAALQGYLLEYRNDPIKAEESIDKKCLEDPESGQSVNELEFRL